MFRRCLIQKGLNQVFTWKIMRLIVEDLKVSSNLQLRKVSTRSVFSSPTITNPWKEGEKIYLGSRTSDFSSNQSSPILCSLLLSDASVTPDPNFGPNPGNYVIVTYNYERRKKVLLLFGTGTARVVYLTPSLQCVFLSCQDGKMSMIGVIGVRQWNSRWWLNDHLNSHHC